MTNNICRNRPARPDFFERGQGGFTLMEIIMVMVFLSIALLALMNMMSSSVTGSMNIEFINTATNLANERMEQVFADKRSLGYDYIKQKNYQTEVNPNGYAGFKRIVTITENASNKKVVVTVSCSQIPDCVITAYLTNY